MITNEEKAKEICGRDVDSCDFDCINCANQFDLANLRVMAQWKDKQFAKKIEQIKENIILARDNKEYYKVRPEVALDWVLRLIDEINKDN